MTEVECRRAKCSGQSGRNSRALPSSLSCAASRLPLLLLLSLLSTNSTPHTTRNCRPRDYRQPCRVKLPAAPRLYLLAGAVTPSAPWIGELHNQHQAAHDRPTTAFGAAGTRPLAAPPYDLTLLRHFPPSRRHTQSATKLHDVSRSLVYLQRQHDSCRLHELRFAHLRSPAALAAGPTPHYSPLGARPAFLLREGPWITAPPNPARQHTHRVLLPAHPTPRDPVSYTIDTPVWTRWPPRRRRDDS